MSVVELDKPPVGHRLDVFTHAQSIPGLMCECTVWIAGNQESVEHALSAYRAHLEKVSKHEVRWDPSRVGWECTCGFNFPGYMPAIRHLEQHGRVVISVEQP